MGDQGAWARNPVLELLLRGLFAEKGACVTCEGFCWIKRQRSWMPPGCLLLSRDQQWGAFPGHSPFVRGRRTPGTRELRPNSFYNERLLPRHLGPEPDCHAEADVCCPCGSYFGARHLGLSHDPVHDNAFYGKCMIGGILSCGITHTGITPLDVVKCNMQVNPAKYKSLLSGIKTIASEEGVSALYKGWAPTAFGYSMQGMCKFGFYDVFKDMYSTMAGEENAYKYRGAIYLAGSASAEFFADMLLCPMEMVKVKVQTSPAGTFPTKLSPAIAAMKANPETRFPFGSLVPLWSRQIPYTMAKFFFFEKVVEAFYTHVFTEPKSSYPKSTQLGITFASGYLAGIICAIVSHPADSVVSLMGKPANKGKGFGQIVSETGMFNLATKGLGTRIIMIGTLTGAQWWIYDTFKTAMGMGTSGGAVKKN